MVTVPIRSAKAYSSVKSPVTVLSMSVPVPVAGLALGVVSCRPDISKGPMVTTWLWAMDENAAMAQPAVTTANRRDMRTPLQG